MQTTDQNNFKPTFLLHGTRMGVYYGEEHMTVDIQSFNKEKIEELIFLLTDISNSKTALKLKDKDGEYSVKTFKSGNILTFFTKLTGTERQQILGQLDLDKIATKLTNYGIKPKSRHIQYAHDNPNQSQKIS